MGRVATLARTTKRVSRKERETASITCSVVLAKRTSNRKLARTNSCLQSSSSIRNKHTIHAFLASSRNSVGRTAALRAAMIVKRSREGKRVVRKRQRAVAHQFWGCEEPDEAAVLGVGVLLGCSVEERGIVPTGPAAPGVSAGINEADGLGGLISFRPFAL